MQPSIHSHVPLLAAEMGRMESVGYNGAGMEVEA